MSKTRDAYHGSLQSIVEQLLEAHPKARDDDKLLYCYYLNHMGCSKHTSFWDVCGKIWDGELASFETIGRIRRKVQEGRSDLSSSEEEWEGKRRTRKKILKYVRGE